MPMTPTRHVPQISHWRSRLPGRTAVCLKERRLLTPLARRSTMYSKHAGGARSRTAINQFLEQHFEALLNELKYLLSHTLGVAL